MKKALPLVIALALLLTSALPALAELPDGFSPAEMMKNFNIRMPKMLMTMGDPSPAGTSVKYRLLNPEISADGMRFSNSDGNVTLETRSASGEFDLSAPAESMTFTLGSGINPIDATTLKLAFLGAVSDIDHSVAYENLMGWLPEISREDDLALNGYTLSYRRIDGAQVLSLTADKAASGGSKPAHGKPKAAPAATEAPAPTETPVATEAPVATAELPECFVPQTAAMYFNNLLGPVLEMLGAPDPGTMAEQFKLTKADIVGSVLYLSSADGKVEISANFDDGQPAVDRQASTLGLAISKNADRSEVLSLSATFAFMLSQVDSTVGDFEAILNWMSDAVDGDGEAAVYPLNGYSMIFARGENGCMYTLVPTGAAQAPVAETTPEPTVEATPEPTAAPTPEPTAAPLPETLDGAVLEWNGLSLKPVRYSITAYSSEYVTLNLYFRILNNSDQVIRIDVDDVTIDGKGDVHGTSIGKAEPYSDTGEDSSEYILVTSDYGVGSNGLQTIADARKVDIHVVLKSEDFDRLYTQDISVDLDALEGKRDVPDGFEAKVDPTPAPVYEPSPYDYKTLKQGSKGQAVREMQQRLIDLGYLDGKADGSFGKKTTAAVRTFCEQHGLATDGSNASPEMQAKLFSSSARAYSEAYIPLVIGATAKWDPVRSVNTFFFKTQVINTSRTRTIRGFELKCYTTNVWGDKLDGGVVYSMTNTIRVKPGETAWSNNFNLGNWYSTDTVWIGISKIVFDDGEIREVDDVDFYSCVLPSKK